MPGFISVHVGAGYHSEKASEQYVKLCNRACRKGMEVIRGGGSAWEAACIATAVLEDSALTNAGLGSNLTWNGQVECDASVMDGRSLKFAAVGAVSGVRNPILLARALCLAQSTHLSLNRVPPCFLVGEGATQWGKEHGVNTIDSPSMITERARKQYIKYKKQAELGEQKGEVRLDTVGAVCVDLEGYVGAASSSGGILLKQPGRVGQAGVYGCGCWAEGNIGVTVSGSGEDIIKTCLARTVALNLTAASSPTSSLHTTIKHSFLDSPFISPTSQKLCGLLVVKCEEDKHGEFLICHNTSSMGVGYMSSNQRNPKSRLSRLPRSAVSGESLLIEGICW